MFAVEQLLGALATHDCYFWATHAGAELDLLVFLGGKRFGFEIKFTDAPRTTRSVRVARSDLGLTRVFVVYPGAESYSLDDGIDALSIQDVAQVRERLH